jgi:hypothetical protein
MQLQIRCAYDILSGNPYKRYSAGETLAQIAKSYGVDISMISRL